MLDSDGSPTACGPHMFGSQRATVSRSAGILQAAGLIMYHRGTGHHGSHVHVLEAARLSVAHLDTLALADLMSFTQISQSAYWLTQANVANALGVATADGPALPSQGKATAPLPRESEPGRREVCGAHPRRARPTAVTSAASARTGDCRSQRASDAHESVRSPRPPTVHRASARTPPPRPTG